MTNDKDLQAEARNQEIIKILGWALVFDVFGILTAIIGIGALAYIAAKWVIRLFAPHPSDG